MTDYQIATVILILLWWFIHGLIEYMVFKHDWVIRRIDYHTGRLVESGIVLLLAYMPQLEPLLLIGSWMIGNFIYEFVLSGLYYNKIFPKRKDYGILGLYIQRRWWFDFIILGIGVVLMMKGIG